jgi:signal transduction histidine kinase
MEAQDLATLYGSEHWLRRVFLECLESALRTLPAGGTLEIEHRQMGPRALVVFRDCGVFGAASGLAVDMPHAEKPRAVAAPSRARDQIGLKLCQHIVSLHGGQLREEEEDGLRNFLIDLPTGAPHRDDHAQLDIAQAQRYAHDLAALMARARGAASKNT